MEMDGASIVWNTGVCDNYQVIKRDSRLIKKLAEMKIRPDILFIGSPSGIGPELAHGIRETYLESTCLNPEHVFILGHELLESKVFYQLSRKEKINQHLIYWERT